MRKTFVIVLIFILVCGALLIPSASKTSAQADILTMDSPSKCPDSGCAAGQRINFMLTFPVNPEQTSTPNTQICVYIPADSQPDGIGSWAEDEWISSTGLESGSIYTDGERDSICADNNGNKLIYAAYTTLPEETTSDKLEFALTIHPNTTDDGHVSVKVFETDGGGNFLGAPSHSQELEIIVDSTASPAYVARTPDDCGSHSPCFVNSGDDEPDGVGTGLRDAVNAMEDGSEIKILNDFFIKDHAVLIDKTLSIQGSEGAKMTYSGDQYSEPLLIFTKGGMIKDLMIDDGHWESPSRTLIQVNTSEDLTIEHNTLTSGWRAVDIKEIANTKTVSVIFNHITDNAAAIYNTSASGKMIIYANNIIDNGSINQVYCNSNGIADHNYWGENKNAEGSAPNCDVSNGKQLGAPILISSGGVGVEALSKTVTNTMTFDIFDEDIDFKHTKGENFEIIVVNHGQGDESNIPFFEDAGAVDPCSNFYDVFLAENESASNLVLSLKYDRTYSCRTRIESSAYCNQDEDAGKYPLWWYDPANDITEGWDRTGQDPEGAGADGAGGQQTVCDMDNNTISVTIDTTGRPGISGDLLFTPFVTGLPMSGITVSEFTGEFVNSRTYLKWTTSNERNIKEFRIYRSDSRTGSYTLIASGIDAIGYAGSQSTINYTYTDTKVTSLRDYYYKLEVIDNLGESVNTYGPRHVYTLYSTRTATYYPTKTPIYIPKTSTPRMPTQVRTYRVSPDPSRTNYVKLTGTPTNTAKPDSGTGYPLETTETPGTDGYPAPGNATTRTSTPNPLPTPTKNENGSKGTNLNNWWYILIGATSGLVLLAVISFILMKSYIS